MVPVIVIPPETVIPAVTLRAIVDIRSLPSTPSGTACAPAAAIFRQPVAVPFRTARPNARIAKPVAKDSPMPASAGHQDPNAPSISFSMLSFVAMRRHMASKAQLARVRELSPARNTSAEVQVWVAAAKGTPSGQGLPWSLPSAASQSYERSRPGVSGRSYLR